MMFSCCHPRLPEEAQVALMLHILCGFSVDEVAERLCQRRTPPWRSASRAPKKSWPAPKRLFDIADAADFAARLPAVQRALYLLFNEGYHGARPNPPCAPSSARKPCASRRCCASTRWRQRPRPTRWRALMCLHAARLPARLDAAGDLRALGDQDRSQWDAKLVAGGEQLLDRSAFGPSSPTYHLEAAIAWVHASAHRRRHRLGNDRLALRPADAHSPLAGRRAQPRHRHRASGRPAARPRGVARHRELDRLASYPFYHAAFGEFELRSGTRRLRARHFDAALPSRAIPWSADFLLSGWTRVTRLGRESLGVAAIAKLERMRQVSLATPSVLNVGDQ